MNLQQKQLKILLIGDSCYDIYHYGRVDRISPEAPIPVFDHLFTKIKNGMASNVYENFKALGVDVDIFTTFSENKNRYIDIKTKQQLLRVDEKITKSSSTNLKKFNYKDYDAVVISDYNKGFVTYEDITEIRSMYNGPVYIDTKKQDLKKFNDCILKLNQYEWESRISEHNNTIVTYGSDKVTYKEKIYNPPKVEAYDVCGAGDTFLAALVYKHLNSSIDEAIEFAMKAAAITVQNSGVYAPTLSEINND